MKLSTMADVARLADVSVATVSAVVNGKGGVSEARRRRVEEAVSALDYHPDAIARSLKVGRTNVVGMVVPDVTNAFFPEVMRGLEDEAWACGYSLLLCDSGEDPARERRHLDTLFSRRVDGVVLACADASTAYDRLTRRRFPIVFVDRVPVGYARGSVTTDNAGAAYDATRHLIELGHTRIAIIAGRMRFSNGIDRAEGFRRAMQEAHLPVREEYFRRGDFQVEGGYREGLALLRLAEPPTAVFSCNNKMTLGLIRALGESGVRCPDEVSIVGFDDFEWAANFSPKLTAVAQPTREMGREAMRMLLRRMRPGGEEGEAQDGAVVLRAELRVRESTSPPQT